MIYKAKGESSSCTNLYFMHLDGPRRGNPFMFRGAASPLCPHGRGRRAAGTPKGSQFWDQGSWEPLLWTEQEGARFWDEGRKKLLSSFHGTRSIVFHVSVFMNARERESSFAIARVIDVAVSRSLENHRRTFFAAFRHERSR